MGEDLVGDLLDAAFVEVGAPVGFVAIELIVVKVLDESAMAPKIVSKINLQSPGGGTYAMRIFLSSSSPNPPPDPSATKLVVP